MNVRRGNNFISGIVLFICMVILCVVVIGNVMRSTDAKQAVLLEESIKRAAVTCYAAEGRYPPSFPYLKNNYGINVNFDKYAVLYTVNGSNIMPDISVIQVSK